MLLLLPYIFSMYLCHVLSNGQNKKKKKLWKKNMKN